MKSKTLPKRISRKTATKKSWTDRMEQDNSVVKILDKDFADMKAGSKMYISNPKIIEAYIRNIPKGSSVDLKTLRNDLAIEHMADVTCPVTTGIFLRIVAEAASEQFEQGKSIGRITPFWRVIDEKMPLAKKLTFGTKLIHEQRKKEKLDIS
ncbi:MAG TPA: hypothetical protein PLM56_01525 [Cyclobacteriaceae bacterium]|jgi:hypothetical protein|nr:hypothetical protein [Cyclobacteriaceae bacterium]HNT50997.1 hypothetical protein [Cyclobacteriaceae bacterium]HRE66160.1 hypothetical protein [Cyclobacteriaceae bacterium]HRF32149.1 hypothetical protein [Cyclobacteriaceae bacterium]